MRIVRRLTDPSLRAPVGVAVDPARDRLFVADPLERRVVWLDAGGGPLHVVEEAGAAAPDVVAPVALAVDGGGHLYVLDAGPGEVRRYELDTAADAYVHDGTFLGGDGATFAGTALSSPSDVAAHGGLLYVLDAGNKRVAAVDLQTGATTEPVSDPALVDPAGLAVSAGGEVRVADAGSHEVITYVQGARAGAIGGYGAGNGELERPEAVEVDAGGVRYVVDAGNQRVQRYSTQGAFEAVVAGPRDLGSPRKLASMDGRLYVADPSRAAVHVLGTAPGGPEIEVEPPTVDFGAVPADLGVAAPVVVRNSGADPLAVQQVRSDDPAFSPDAASFTVPAGGERTILVTFEPPDAGYRVGRLRIESDSAAEPTVTVTLRGHGTAPAPIDAALVLDRSGSMRQSAGARTKIELLQDAAALFVELARAEAGDSLGVVSYSDTARTEHPFVQVQDSPVDTRAGLEAAVGQLAVGGSTSIGAGIEAARALLPAGGSDEARRVLVVVTDGKENRPPYVAPVQDGDPAVDLSAYDGIDIYTVGLGLGTEVDLRVLRDLATHGHRGAFYLTEDDWLSLQKFFVEIFGDAVGEYVALDPAMELVGEEPTEASVNIGDVDRAATFVVMWPDPDTAVHVRLVTPGGREITGADAIDQPQIRYGHGSTYAFFRVPLPRPGALGGDHDGEWKIVAQAKMGPERRMPFEVCVLVRSLLGIECGVAEGGVPGEPVTLEVTTTLAGRPVAADAVSVEMRAPTRGRGVALTSEALPSEPSGPSGATVRSSTPPLQEEGAYELRAVAEVVRDGVRLRRECRHTVALVAHPDPRRTELRIVEEARSGGALALRVLLTPRDATGRRIGPGEALRGTLSGTGAEIGRFRDRGDGTYEAFARVPVERDPSLVHLPGEQTPRIDPRTRRRSGRSVRGGIFGRLAGRLLDSILDPLSGRRGSGRASEYEDVFLVVELRGTRLTFSVERALQGRPAAVRPDVPGAPGGEGERQ